MSGRTSDGNARRTGGRKRLRALITDARGATAIEYGLILALVVLTMLASLTQVANVTVGLWNDISAKVRNAS